ncbi:MAG: fructose transporter subunit [Deltaproteobacteria bacterium]|jgi:PTS system nitrogen regulatory IIA component|nr:fructose transporter subunit [Deltaproteobacteria bacterium]
MKIVDFLKEEWILPDLRGTDKTSVLKELSAPLVEPCRMKSHDDLLSILAERERLESTGIGGGLAIPHGRVKTLSDFAIALGRSVKGVDFDSIDRKPTHLFFLVMAPENSAANNLKLLGRIVTLLKDASFRKRLMEAKTQREIFQALSQEDEKY